MPFLALAGPIAGALAGTGAISAGTAGIVGGLGAAAGAIGSGIMASNAKTSANAALDAGTKASQIDINKLDEQTRAIAKQNAIDSAELERQLTPEVPQLRIAANNEVLSGVNDQTLNRLGSRLGTGIDSKYNTPLLQAAIAKAYDNLNLGGKLGIDQQNLVTRGALATAGTVNKGGLGLGRDLVARDLGLSSLDLERQRLADASGLGQAQLGLEQANDSRMMTRAQLISQLQGQRFGQNLGAAQYGESIQRPVVGLDPSAVANLTANNANNLSGFYTNKANIAGATSNNYMQMAGNIVGNSMANYNKAPLPYMNLQNGGVNPATGQKW